mgnify:CR=1 FL=1
MSTSTNGFLDNFVKGVTNPKGNLGDFRHASRTFVKNTYRLTPKVKFLYHVFFDISPDAKKLLPTWEQRHRTEAGLLVKAAQLPSFSSTIETRKQYNRVKHVHTKLDYQPVNITFHDDNMGITTALMEMYYRYYYADGNYGKVKNPFSKKSVEGDGSTGKEGLPGDSTYRGISANGNKVPFGLDNKIKDPFFHNIQLSLLTRHTYTTYTLVNPIISDWSHGDVTAGDSQGVENTMTINYESVWYSRGTVQSGDSGNPVGFGLSEHYDTTPSPITLAGGGTVNFGQILSGAADLFDYVANGNTDVFSNPIGAAIAAANLLRNGQGLTAEGILTEGENILTGVLENASREAVLGGFTDIQIPGDD